jgi:predicted ATPase with chaperone activity
MPAQSRSSPREIQSYLGRISAPLLDRRPARREHNPTPGEISIAHHGVLFLDELPEFPGN